MSHASHSDQNHSTTDLLRLPWRAVLLVHLLRSVLALAFAWPAARLVGVATLALPGGDAVLFDDGGLYLAEVLRLHRTELASVLEGGAFSVMLAVYAGLFPLGMLIHAITQSTRARHHPAVAPRAGAPYLLAARAERGELSRIATLALRNFGPFSFLLGLALAAMVPAILLPQSVGALLETRIHDAIGDRGSDLASIAFNGASLAMGALVMVTHDLARAAVVRHDMSGLHATRHAILAFRARPLRAAGAWIARALIGTSLVASGAWITMRLGVATSASFAAVAGVHQLVTFVLLVLRANWLQNAVAIVSFNSEANS